MTQYYTDQDRIDAQTMRIDVSTVPMLIFACRWGCTASPDLMCGSAEPEHRWIRVHPVCTAAAVREAHADAAPHGSGKGNSLLAILICSPLRLSCTVHTTCLALVMRKIDDARPE